MGGDLCQIWHAQHFYSMYQDHAVIHAQYSTRQAQYGNMHAQYANTQAQYAILQHAHNRPSCMHNMLIIHAQYAGHNLSYIRMWYMNVGMLCVNTIDKLCMLNLTQITPEWTAIWRVLSMHICCTLFSNQIFELEYITWVVWVKVIMVWHSGLL